MSEIWGNLSIRRLESIKIMMNGVKGGRYDKMDFQSEEQNLGLT